MADSRCPADGWGNLAYRTLLIAIGDRLRTDYDGFRIDQRFSNPDWLVLPSSNHTITELALPTFWPAKLKE